jgi:hypothetical protein
VGDVLCITIGADRAIEIAEHGLSHRQVVEDPEPLHGIIEALHALQRLLEGRARRAVLALLEPNPPDVLRGHGLA